MRSPHKDFNDDHTPIAFLITFRCYGTWLHGDPRGSVDRLHNIYGTPRLGPERARVKYERTLMLQPPVRLGAKRRAAVTKGIARACVRRRWQLWAVNVRTNHVHAVVAADCHSTKVRSTLKAYATRNMRKTGCWNSDKSPWAGRGSRISLWDEDDLNAATVYVLYDQGAPLPDNDDD
jgi:REP element-mobilizing transposase RayT